MLGIYYLAFTLAGMSLANHYSHHSPRFFWREYLALLVPPLLGLVGIIFLVGIHALYVFVITALIGPFIEWFVGYFYHRAIGSRLWIYERYTLPGRYTSYLTVPMWGFGLTVI